MLQVMMMMVTMMMNGHARNRQSPKKSDHDLVDKMRLGVYSRDRVMHIEYRNL